MDWLDSYKAELESEDGGLQQGVQLANTHLDNFCDFNCSSIRDGIG